MSIQEIQKGSYWDLGKRQRELAWVEIIAHGLGISELDALKRIRRNNALPLEEYIPSEDSTVYPRFNANTVLLAQASPNFEGPRGPRPTLASAANVFRISEVTPKNMIDYVIRFKRASGGILNFLKELKLTASNPNTAPEGVEFSDDDIKGGIYIPRKIDLAAAGAIGIVFANGNFSNEQSLALSASIKNRDFYFQVVRKAFENAFNFSPDQNIRIFSHPGNPIKPEDYDCVLLSYGSKALRTYFLKHLHYPSSREERKQFGLPEELKNMREEPQDEFLAYYLASCATVDNKKGIIKISDVSKPLLTDIQDLINERVTKHSTSLVRKNMGDSFALSISSIPAMELYLFGYLDLNPRIKAIAERFFQQGLGNRAKVYLRREHPGEMERRETELAVVI